MTYSLNAVGQRTGRHDAAFGPESYACDAIDQVIGANYGGVRSEGFAYDAMGNRQSASDTAAGITAYTVRADNAYTSVGAETHRGQSWFINISLRQGETSPMPSQVRIEFARAMYHVTPCRDRWFCCRLIRRTRERLPGSAEWQEMPLRILEMP